MRGQIELTSEEHARLELVSILNIAIDSIDVIETQKLKRKWLLGDTQEKKTGITLSAKDKKT